jgi:predicted component of type VI protein secretion system
MDVHLLIKPKNEGQQGEVTLSDPGQFVLGRGPSSAALLDGPGISREHVAISVQDSEVFVSDVSVNGTWINGNRLPQHQKHRVGPDDVVEIPGYEFVFQLNGRRPTDGIGISDTIQQAEATSIPSVPSGPFSAFLASFTFLDRLIIGLALLSIALVIFYFFSY